MKAYYIASALKIGEESWEDRINMDLMIGQEFGSADDYLPDSESKISSKLWELAHDNEHCVDENEFTIAGGMIVFSGDHSDDECLSFSGKEDWDGLTLYREAMDGEPLPENFLWVDGEIKEAKELYELIDAEIARCNLNYENAGPVDSVCVAIEDDMIRIYDDHAEVKYPISRAAELLGALRALDCDGSTEEGNETFWQGLPQE